MVRLEPGKDGCVLRSPSQVRGVRRLPLVSQSDAPTAGLQIDVSTPVDIQDEQPDLRAIFAEELATLAAEARADAVEQGRAQAQRELAAAREKLQAELTADFASQLENERQQLGIQREQLATLMDALEAQREGLVEAMLPTVVRLSTAVVLRMLGSHATSRALVGDLARHAIDEYRLTGDLRVLVSEADYQAILDGNDEQAFTGMFQVDHEAAPGSCVIDFGTGSLDASLNTQLDTLRAALMKAGGGRVGTG